jgi:hypothetical protein
MSQSKSIIFIVLLCLLFSSTKVFALVSADNQQSLKQLNTEEKVVPETKEWSIANIRSSLDNTLNRASKSIDETKIRIKNSLDGTMGGLKESLDGTMSRAKKSLDGTMVNLRTSLSETMDGIGEFAEGAGEVAFYAGAVFIIIMAENHYHHHHGHW